MERRTKMAKRVHCDRCNAMVNEVVGHRVTFGEGVLLTVVFAHGDHINRIDVCASCARDFLPLSPPVVREFWERAIVRTEAVNEAAAVRMATAPPEVSE